MSQCQPETSKAIDIKSFYVVASTDCQSDDPDRWSPMLNACYPTEELARGDAVRRSHQGIDGDYYGVVEYSSAGTRLIGEVHPGINEW